jgi:hypothetical protein
MEEEDMEIEDYTKIMIPYVRCYQRIISVDYLRKGVGQGELEEAVAPPSKDYKHLLLVLINNQCLACFFQIYVCST